VEIFRFVARMSPSWRIWKAFSHAACYSYAQTFNHSHCFRQVALHARAYVTPKKRSSAGCADISIPAQYCLLTEPAPYRLRFTPPDEPIDACVEQRGEIYARRRWLAATGSGRTRAAV